MSDADPIRVEQEQDGRVVWLTLDRPHVMNAVNTATGLRLGELLTDLAEQPRVRVIILTGAGERAFSAGGDLKERQRMTPAQWTHQHRIFEHVYQQVREMPKPIFAAVNGVAVGGGCELAMSTDFIIASANARFGQPEVKVGIMPGAGGTMFLPRRLPRGLGLQLLMTGEMISAEEAHRWGLVNKVVAPERLHEEAAAIAAAIAANSPAAVQQAKRSARIGLDSPIEQAYQIEIAHYQRMVDHPDRYEGVNAFNEKRAPKFLDA